MSDKKRTIILIIMFAVAVIGAGVLYKALSVPLHPAETPAEAVSAPDFTMLDSKGGTVSLSDYTGMPIVLNFWASWCGPCKREMPAFDALAEEMKDDIRFLMVNLTDGSSDTIEIAAKFIADNKYTFPVYYDTESEGALAYSVRSVPMTFFIDSDGNVKAYHSGAMDEDTLREGIALIYEQP